MSVDEKDLEWFKKKKNGKKEREQHEPVVWEIQNNEMKRMKDWETSMVNYCKEASVWQKQIA